MESFIFIEVFLFFFGREGRFFRLLLCMGEVLRHYLSFEEGGEEEDERGAMDGLG